MCSTFHAAKKRESLLGLSAWENKEFLVWQPLTKISCFLNVGCMYMYVSIGKTEHDQLVKNKNRFESESADRPVNNRKSR
jgi:hypothetical protein